MSEFFNYYSYEEQYMDILKQIISYGFSQKNERTGVFTKRLGTTIITVDLEKEFPILKTKNVIWKSALKEILWIMQKQSNMIKDLDSHIWDAWADDHGSIGASYGFQARKPVTINGVTYQSQVHYVLNRLEDDSSDRRAVIDLWNVDDLNRMNLVPCCYSSVYNIINGRLNCTLIQRSADYMVGVPFNTTQYAFLTCLFANHLGVKPGVLTHVMCDTHVYCYESHLKNAEIMLNTYEENKDKILNSKVELEIPEGKNFFEIALDDVKLKNYEFFHNLKFDVAV